MDTIEHLEHLLHQIPDSDADMRQCSRVFNQFIDTAISAARSKGMVNEGHPLSFFLQELQSTRSKELECAIVRYERALKLNAPKVRKTEYYEAEEAAIFHMRKDMSLFIQAYRESALSTS